MVGMTRFPSSIPVFLTTLCLAVGCVPPPAETPKEEAEAPPEPGTIPWAEGTAPENGAASAREVGEQPRSQDHADENDFSAQDGGIVQAGDPQSCTGKVPPALRAAVQVRAADTRACYDQVPESKAGSEGDVKFNIRVSVDGSVQSASLIEDTFHVPEATACIEKILKKRFDARPQGGCAMFVIPIHLAAEMTEVEAEAKSGE